MASLPTLTIEAAPGYGPLSTIPGGAWVSLGTVKSGTVVDPTRSRETDRFQGGRLALAIDNTNRALDPTNPSSAIAVGTPVRLRATFGATTYPVALMYIDELEPQWQSLTTDIANLTATDAFAYLAGLAITECGYSAQVQSLLPGAYWRLDDAAGLTVLADSSGHARTLSAQIGPFSDSAISAQAQSLIARDPNAAMILSASTLSASFDFARTSSFTVEATFGMFDIDAVPVAIDWPGAAVPLGVSYFNSSFGTFFGYGDVSARLVFAGPGLGVDPSYCSKRIDDGLPHTVHLIRRGGAIEFWVDNVLVKSATMPATAAGSTVNFGNAHADNSVNQSSGLFVVDEIAVYTFALSSAQQTATYTLARTPWVGDLAGARISRVLDLMRWPAGMRSIDTGKSIIAAPDPDQDWGDTKVLDYLQRVAEAEGGRLFVGRDGSIVFHDRQRPHKPPYDAVQAVYSDQDPTTRLLPVTTPTALPYMTGGLKGSESMAEVANQGVVTRAAQNSNDNPVTQVYNDATSQTALKLVRAITQSEQLNPTDLEAANKARAMVYPRSTPTFRLKELTLDGAATDLLWPEILGRQIGDLVRVLRHPPGGGTPYDDELRVEGRTLTIAKRSMVSRLVASKADTTVWMRIGDQFGGKLFW